MLRFRTYWPWCILTAQSWGPCPPEMGSMCWTDRMQSDTDRGVLWQRSPEVLTFRRWGPCVKLTECRVILTVPRTQYWLTRESRTWPWNMVSSQRSLSFFLSLFRSEIFHQLETAKEDGMQRLFVSFSVYIADWIQTEHYIPTMVHNDKVNEGLASIQLNVHIADRGAGIASQ